MTEIPKRFPEYSIMYKTLKEQINKLENQKKINSKESEQNKIKIKNYKKELEKIKKMFPENYFEE